VRGAESGARVHGIALMTSLAFSRNERIREANVRRFARRVPVFRGSLRGPAAAWRLLPLVIAALSACDGDVSGDGEDRPFAPTGTGEVVLAVWVAGPEGAQDIMYRFFQQ